MFRRILATIAALSLASTMAHAFEGSYTVNGTNIDGSPYGGTAEITLTSQTTCNIVWTTGPTSSKGICMRNDDAFSAAYILGEAVGLVIYKIQPDGVLEGRWTISGVEGAGTETLTPK